MARDFTKNLSNFLSLGVGGINNMLFGAPGVTFAVWANFDTFGTVATNNRLINEFASGTTSSLLMNVGNATPKLVVNARSLAADSLQTKTSTTTITSGVWWHLAGVIDYAGGTVTPYVNGTAEGGGAATFGSPTYAPGVATGHAAIGCGLSATPTPLSTGDQVDGRLDRMAIWNKALSAVEVLRLANGETPTRIRTSALVGYYRLDSSSSLERNLAWPGPIGTVTGSLPYASGPAVRADLIGGSLLPYKITGSAAAAKAMVWRPRPLRVWRY